MTALRSGAVVVDAHDPPVFFGGRLDDHEPVPKDAYVAGEEPWWDPRAWPDTVASARNLRAQIRRAANKGVVVRRAKPEELVPGTKLRAHLERVVERWLRTRHLAPMRFVVDVRPFEKLDERRVFVAEAGADVVGLLVATPVAPPPQSSSSPESGAGAAPSRWLLEHVLRVRDAPNGTAEALIDAAMRALADEGAVEVTLGLAPLSGPVPAPLAWVRKLTRGLFDFRGLHDFKSKLKPKRWQRVLVEHPGQGAARATLRVLRAFSGGSIVRFGFRTALRGPPPLIRLVATLLIPWTVALATLDTERFFPSPWVQQAWIAFDVVVAACLFVLARRITRHHVRRWLHFALAVAITADAALTMFESFTWNVPRLGRGGVVDAVEVAVVVAACLAPSLVAVLLWSSLRFRER